LQFRKLGVLGFELSWDHVKIGVGLGFLMTSSALETHNEDAIFAFYYLKEHCATIHIFRTLDWHFSVRCLQVMT